MAEIFNIDRTVITKHLKNIFNEGELDKNRVCAKFAHTASDGKTYNTEFYNLDAIISVGYRVNSKKTTEFRIWATKILNSYMTKRFALDDDRFLKGGKINQKYFDELLERIKVIRTSERQVMKMKDWINETDNLLKFRKKEILKDSGKISHKQAIDKANKEYEKFKIKQDMQYISSMDEMYQKYLEENKCNKK